MSQYVLRGSSVSPGFATGPARVRSSTASSPVRRLQVAEVDAEVARFDAALSRSEDQLRRDINFASHHVGDHNARIFESQLAFLADLGLRDSTRNFIRDHQVDAASALERALRHFAKHYEKMLPAVRQDILKEVRGAWGIVLNTLRGGDDSDSTPRVIVTDELTPMFASMIERGAVAAVLAASGGRYSHGAILARSFGVPAIVGVRDLLRRVTEGTILAVNGDDGSVLVNPTPEETQQFEARRKERAEHRRELQAAALQPASTKDGVRVEVMANVDTLRDLEGIDLRTIDGIGLYRTEFLFLDSKEFPSEDEQYHQYRRAIEKIGRRPVVFRTLDSGGDKPLPYFQTPKEANPAMGWRGLRISLEVPDLFIPQLRAILRAGAHGDARLLVPMVTSAEEMVRVREILASILADLKATGVPHRADMPLGAMIEVPAAALTMDAIAEVSDFVSIGTNDLVQYLLGVDRDNTRVGGLYDPFHPGVLRTIAEVVSKARTSNRDVSLCGELAGDPQTTALLAGLGLRCLSMAPVAVPQVKAAVRSFSMSEAGELATSALASRSATEVREKVRALEDRRSHSGGTHQAGGSQPTGRSQ
jgi:phosphotransferase system enzyme I (PtsI)